MMAAGRTKLPVQRRPPYWTRDRVCAGLRLFYNRHGVAPLSTEVYHRVVCGTGKIWCRDFPSFYAVLKFFSSLASLGILTDRSHESWSAEEDWYLSEAVGLLARADCRRPAAYGRGRQTAALRPRAGREDALGVDAAPDRGAHAGAGLPLRGIHVQRRAGLFPGQSVHLHRRLAAGDEGAEGRHPQEPDGPRGQYPLPRADGGDSAAGPKTMKRRRQWEQSWRGGP